VRFVSKQLVIGYGNPDREDDGVAWHILRMLAERYGRGNPAADLADITDLDLGEPERRDGVPDLIGALQLTPEMAEVIGDYDKVVFVDAHTGAYADDIHAAPATAGYQASPFTHHLTPDTCVALAQAAFGRTPQAMVVSVRGYRFGFTHALSDETAALATQAAERIAAWLTD
jgi:hydrogenase maturation protease